MTVGDWTKPIFVKYVLNSIRLILRPTVATKLLFETVCLFGIYCEIAAKVVRSISGVSNPDANAASVAILADATSAFGETLSYGKQSQAGKSKTIVFGEKNQSDLRIRSKRLSSLATKIIDFCCTFIKLDKIFASKPSGDPDKFIIFLEKLFINFA